ncbi:hypothetical protein [Scytonema millei]|uniref:Uncharacterized protein n=1 Tax=Scytonema millei VB511283 TaxID=1245923 RepID=A0A9X5I6B0_9CYAN|nr:hypothetical protein [Scytonema millei]NHC36915.1 hypothetical protein [Scytonema millei VB511283]
MSKKPKGWYEAIAIRPVMHVDGYESSEKVCSYVAEIYFSSTEEKLHQKLITNSKNSTYVSLYTLYKVGEAKCPTYWVGKDLLTALMQSDLTIEADSLHWAMKTGIFMLPKNVVFSPEKRSIQAIFWHFDPSNGYLYLTASDGASFFCRRFKAYDNLRKITYADVQDINPQAVVEFNEYLQSIFLRLILIMECRSELVDTESKVIRVNQGFAKDKAKDYYEPLWVGRNYRVQREETQDKGGTHASPRVHWRRGYLRNQPYGEGRQQRRLVWIEPVLVIGKG